MSHYFRQFKETIAVRDKQKKRLEKRVIDMKKNGWEQVSDIIPVRTSYGDINYTVNMKRSKKEQ